MTRLWVGFAVVIAYGSLYPFDFQARSLDARIVSAFLDTCCHAGRPGDVLGNALLFVPFGFLGILSLRDKAGTLGQALIVCLGGTVIALALQIAQLYLPSRNESLQDVGWNFVGILAGVLLGLVGQRHLLGISVRFAQGALIPLLLIGSWMTYRLIPFVPSIDLQSLKDSVSSLFRNPQIEFVGTFHDCVAWLIVAYLLQRLRRDGNLDRYLPALMVGTFCLEILIVANEVHASNLSGALLALFLWWGGLRSRSWQEGFLAAMLCAVLIAAGFAPFVPNPQPLAFNWLPFHGLLGGSMYVNALAISEKVYLYGSLVYLLWQSRLGLVLGTSIAALVVSCIEVGQIYFARHTPEITDPLLVVLAALTMAALRHQEVAAATAASLERRRRRGKADVPGAVLLDAASDQVTVTVNLRRAQASFVNRLAQEMEVDASVAYRQIIDTMLNDMEGKKADLSSVRDVVALPVTRPQDQVLSEPGNDPKGRHWTKCTVVLDLDRYQIVKGAAEAKGYSVSRAMRRLLAAYMSRLEGAGSNAGTGLSMPSVVHRPPPLAPLEVGQLSGQPRHIRSGANRRWLSRLWVVTIGLLPIAAAGTFYAFTEPTAYRGPAVLTSAPWANDGLEIVFDHHSHTRYSDGALTPSELVDLARSSGCDALAITDHSDAAGTVSESQLQAFSELRELHPDFLLFGGVEVNMPSYGIREHATVIVEPEVEREILSRLKEAAGITLEEARLASDKKQLDDELLQLAADYLRRDENLVMIYNHPSRRDREAIENYTDITRWNTEGPIFIGFAGAPGHQNGRDIGGYVRPNFTIDRWDRAVAEVGGAWDLLLSEGRQFWGAIASSDYHNPNLDKAPCDFARTHLNAAAFSYEAVLQALRAGTFWADHGRILHRLSFTAEIPGLPSPVHPGSIVDIGSIHNPFVLEVALERGPGAIDSPLEVEFIGNCRTGTSEILSITKLPADSTTATLIVEPTSTGADGKSCFVRARVRCRVGRQPDLMAYTNPIRFLLE